MTFPALRGVWILEELFTECVSVLNFLPSRFKVCPPPVKAGKTPVSHSPFCCVFV